MPVRAADTAMRPLVAQHTALRRAHSHDARPIAVRKLTHAYFGKK